MSRAGEGGGAVAGHPSTKLEGAGNGQRLEQAVGQNLANLGRGRKRPAENYWFAMHPHRQVRLRRADPADRVASTYVIVGREWLVACPDWLLLPRDPRDEGALLVAAELAVLGGAGVYRTGGEA